MTQMPEWMGPSGTQAKSKGSRGTRQDAPADPAGRALGANSPTETEGTQGVREGDANRPPWWSEALRLKDSLGVHELADKLGVRVGVLTAEFRRAGLTGAPAETSPDRRTGSKDARIEGFFHLLGAIPDAEVARRADVSVRTVASYRARHNIDGYTGPRRRPEPRGRRDSRLEDFRVMLGRVPDRVVADHTGMSLGAVRNFRVKHNIAAVGRMSRKEIDRVMVQIQTGVAQAAPAPQQASNSIAWQVVLAGDNGRTTGGVLLAGDVREAVEAAIAAADGDASRVTRIERLGPMLK